MLRGESESSLMNMMSSFDSDGSFSLLPNSAVTCYFSGEVPLSMTVLLLIYLGS